jgi:hypothetical protein
MKHTRFAMILIAAGAACVAVGTASTKDLNAKAGQDQAAFRTRVSIREGRWSLNEEATYRGTKAEGLLMNVRMVNAAFEDRTRPDFDPDANTDEFIAQIPDYVAHGVRAFTVCLQGGSTGYEGALNVRPQWGGRNPWLLLSASGPGAQR